jgi:2-oxo-4-hydroxy-4-carboxy-5-ureidoimidazoline decarboxylase
VLSISFRWRCRGAEEVPLNSCDSGLDEFNALPLNDALAELTSCCTSPSWAARVAEGRPYASLAELLELADMALFELDQAQLDLALAGHPRIGERSAHPYSRREQAGVAGADLGVLAALAESNRSYEERFGHVYLVCAAGRSARELLRVLQDRLNNDPETERGVLRGELGQINRLRLTQVVTGWHE